jgi:hypothetical protein
LNPWEQIGRVLAEAKRNGLPWNAAWNRAMRCFSPERTDGAADLELVRLELEKEREIQKELVPFWRAAYEDRDPTVAEWEKASKQIERRLDDLFAVA